MFLLANILKKYIKIEDIIIYMYDKLVRDKIPNIIEENDEKPVYYVADDEEYRRRLNEKLKEEVDEYLESEDTEEIADILEVVKNHGCGDPWLPCLISSLTVN
jgi:predicted house-cleaning noncanonical NTP pyrophosphatase (MazG superfamily)